MDRWTDGWIDKWLAGGSRTSFYVNKLYVFEMEETLHLGYPGHQELLWGTSPVSLTAASPGKPRCCPASLPKESSLHHSCVRA